MNERGQSKTPRVYHGGPLALIEAQDEPYILPLREYLETHGVRVVVNKMTTSKPLYTIVTGDATFVKHIFSRIHEAHSKKLGIVLGGGKKPEEFSSDTKIVLAYPIQLTPAEVYEIFEFFFTEGKNRLDMRDRHETRNIHDLVARDNARVSAILQDVFHEQATPRGRKAYERKIKIHSRMRSAILGALIGLCIFFLPLILYGSSMVFGSVSLYAGLRALQKGNTQAVTRHASVADYWIRQGSFVLTLTEIPLSWFDAQDMVRGQQRLTSFLLEIIRAETQAAELSSRAKNIASKIFTDIDAASTTTTASDISSLRVSLGALGNSLGLAQGELDILLDHKTFPFSFTWVNKRGERVIDELASFRNAGKDVDVLLSLFTTLSGFREPRTYLLLLQNSMELRPTGGFIGSVGVATFTEGRLTSLDIQDVYTLDGQLKGHVDPPEPIRTILGQEHWYLRDSNWDPDFKESAARAAWFYEKETGGTVAGVIGITTPFMTKLLEATGPINLPDYNERISADNFYGKALYYTKEGFFPGSTQKKDFLGSLMRAMIHTITSDSMINTSLLFRAITSSFWSRDLSLMVADPETQALIEHYGWAGRVTNKSCEGQRSDRCVGAPFMMVEANLGINKVNHFIHRSLVRRIEIHTDGTRSESDTVVLTNQSSGNARDETYVSYIRFLLPTGATMKEVAIDGKPVRIRPNASYKEFPYREQVTIASGQGATGIALSIPPKTEKRIVVSYDSFDSRALGLSGAVLDIVTQKQAGVSYDSITTTILFPDKWIVGIEEQKGVSGPRDFIAKPGEVTYNSVLTRDELTRIGFTQP